MEPNIKKLELTEELRRTLTDRDSRGYVQVYWQQAKDLVRADIIEPRDDHSNDYLVLVDIEETPAPT